MLIECPECSLQVSDKAIACPHCGYPMKKERAKYTKRRRRLPNGFGQITEIKNRNLKKPFRVLVTVGKSDIGRPICKPLKPESYFETYNDAYTALLEYNRQPYDLTQTVTVKGIYERWSKIKFETVSEGRVRSIESAWLYCHSIHDVDIRTIRTKHIKYCIEESSRVSAKGKTIYPSDNLKFHIKILLSELFKYAMEYELVDKNYVENIRLKSGPTAKKQHIIFSNEEINTLWDNKSDYGVGMVLIQCYTGLRPGELMGLNIDSVDVNDWLITCGSKTESGKNRVVPIHTCIRVLVRKYYDDAVSNGSTYLFKLDKFTANSARYNQYLNTLNQLIKKYNLNPEHKPHDCRKHFTTMAKEYKVDEYAIKYIVGHKIKDLTERVYTSRNINWLKEEIEKIKGPV